MQLPRTSRVTDPDLYSPPLTWRGQAWRYLVVVPISLLVWLPMAQTQADRSPYLYWVDVVLGLVSLALSFFRRRWPLQVALAVSLASALSATSTGPGVLVAVSIASRRVMWQIVLVGLAGLGCAEVFWLVEPRVDETPWWLNLGVGSVITVAMLGWGLYIGSRRELIWTLRERADRAEAEQELRVGQARSNERARIAREMHDVLAHRITLITMHAGALAYRTDLATEEIRSTAELIQVKSHEALADLRQVLGVLRGDEETAAELRERPQPTFRDVPSLVREAEQSGMRIRFADQVLDGVAMPDQVGRTAYRIVQEGLTNARKHAPGATVLATVSGSPGDGVRISISNPVRSLQPALAAADARSGRPAPPGAGLGLVGLRERAKLSGGTLDCTREGGMFELRAWLPWAA